MLVIGIDEAGYGPLLGPLVISAVAFEMPDELAQMPLWQVLTDSVTDKPTRSTTKLAITDSKKLYRGRSSLRHLERSALASVWAASGDWPEDLVTLLQTISIEPNTHMTHPWYCHQALSLPRSADPAELSIAARLFVQELRESDIRVAAVRSLPLVEGSFNHLITQMRNKSALLFSQTFRLVDAIIRTTDERQIAVYLDKHGGRSHYVTDLLRIFHSADNLQVVDESPTHSHYKLNFKSRQVELHFIAKGDSLQMPIALGSIVSKYLRELFMVQFNDYWHRTCPKLKPTAGYWTDGQRFVKDLDNMLGSAQVPREQLIRQA